MTRITARIDFDRITRERARNEQALAQTPAVSSPEGEETEMTLYPEWLESHQKEPILPPRIRNMHDLYGKQTENKCGDCIHLYIQGKAGRYFKCGLNRSTHGPGTDWRTSWPACGQFEERRPH